MASDGRMTDGVLSRQDILGQVEDRRRRSQSFSCIVIDLDGFRSVNDLLGERGGDLVLTQAAERLRRVSDQWGATLGWLGADQFLVLIAEDDPGIATARALATSLEEAVRSQPFEVSGRFLRLTASLGVASSTGERPDALHLVRSAHLAMYYAKSSPDAVSVYGDDSERICGLATSDPELAELLNVVLIEHGGSGLLLAYQPILSLETMQIRGLEALVRWDHPQRGMLVPSDFLVSAQTSRLSRDLDGWVLRRALDDLKLLDTLHLGPEFVTVNLTGSDLAYEGCSDEIVAELERRSLDPSRLVIELTETDLAANSIGEIAESLWELRDSGVRVALDDFGTGASSISHLDTFPADVLKIDKSMVLGVGDNRARMSLIRGVVSLARNIGLEVIAEGVDSSEVVEKLASFGCAMGQGYFLGRPMPLSEVMTVLSTSAGSTAGRESCGSTVQI
ncbi:MAG: putative bifunctional diguanylate cyclase/phosphodiesterase [Acidimicrobiales bacterium]